jgi:hypothetical protein
MEIDPEKIAKGKLTFLEAKYLRDRGLLPEGYEMPPNPKEGQEEPPPLPTSRVTPLAEQSIPTIEAQGGIVDDDDDEEDYEEGWNNDQRRAALSERGLSVDGNKSELIARLRRSDLGQLEDDDKFED